MVEGIATELLCSVCDEVCKRGAQMKCCGIRACRSCAVLKMKEIKKCWNEDCGQEDISPSNDLKNDDLLRKAAEHFLKNGKMDPAHEKMLKKTGKKTIIGEDGDRKARKPPVDVVEKFNQSCVYGEKCKRKACLFVHGKPTTADKRKAGVAREKENGKPAPKTATLKKSSKSFDNGKPCDFGALCTMKDTCKFDHFNINKPFKYGVGFNKPCDFGAVCIKKDTCKFDHFKINKPCKYGTGCPNKFCNFDHSPGSKALDRAISKFEKGIRPMGGDLRFILSNKRAMSGGMRDGMGGMASMNMSLRQMERNGFGVDAERRNLNLEQMLKMKHHLDSMLTNFMESGRGGGYGSSFMGMSEDRMDGRNYHGRYENRMDGRNFHGRSEDRVDGHSYMRRSEERMDGRSYMRRSEERMNGRSYMRRSENKVDSRNFMGRSDNRMDGWNWNMGYRGPSGRHHF